MNKIILVMSIALVLVHNTNRFGWSGKQHAPAAQQDNDQKIIWAQLKGSVCKTICSFSRLMWDSNPAGIWVKLIGKMDNNEGVTDKSPEHIATAGYFPVQQTGSKEELAVNYNTDDTRAAAHDLPLTNGFYKVTEKDTAKNGVSRRHVNKNLASTKKEPHKTNTGIIISGFLKVDITN